MREQSHATGDLTKSVVTRTGRTGISAWRSFPVFRCNKSFRGFRRLAGHPPRFWREPGDREWRGGTPETGRPIDVPEFGIELTLDEVYAGIEFD